MYKHLCRYYLGSTPALASTAVHRTSTCLLDARNCVLPTYRTVDIVCTFKYYSRSTTWVPVLQHCFQVLCLIQLPLGTKVLESNAKVRY